jgi:hypothetical protein
MLLSLHQTMNVSKASTDRQQSINHFGCCISYNPRAVLRLVPIIEVLGTIIGNMVNVDVSLPDNERQQSVNRASTELQQSLKTGSTERQQSVIWESTEHQQSVNNLGCYILHNPRALRWHLPIIKILAAFLGQREGDMVTAPVWEWAATERQRFCVLHLV